LTYSALFKCNKEFSLKVKIETDEYTIYERRDGRFAVQDVNGKPINGAQKIEILLANELIVAVLPKVEAEPEAEAEAEAEAEPEVEAEPEAEAEAEAEAEPESEAGGEDEQSGDDK
tara:strand:- start:824 stop:1171 length:348 start_codon:yes stop_codon:yes gene_type:complete